MFFNSIFAESKGRSTLPNQRGFQVRAQFLWLQWGYTVIWHHKIIKNIYWFQLSMYCVREWTEVKVVFKPIFSVTPMYWNDSNNGLFLYYSDEYKFCITWTPFQMGQICVTTLCCSICVCVSSSGRAWQGMPCRQLKLLINALLDNTQANPIIWQAVIRAFAPLSACLPISLLGADMLSVACCKGEQSESHEGSLIFWFSFGQLDKEVYKVKQCAVDSFWKCRLTVIATSIWKIPLN